MEKKRIFIAINLPTDVKSRILDWQKKNSHFNVRWTKEDNMHITLAFIGYVDMIILGNIIGAVSEASNYFKPFEICLEKIVPGPTPLNPRMVWIQMAPNETLKRLNAWVDNALVKNKIPYENSHAFHPHITLARAHNSELRGKKISTDLNLSFMANSVDVMESRLYKTGAEYTVVKKVDLAV